MPPLNGFQKKCIAVAVGQALCLNAADAAVITVNGTDPTTECTLENAIISANTDTATGECDAGSGDDVVRLHSQSALLTSASYGLASGDTAFNITTNITIEGKTIAGGTSTNSPGIIRRFGGGDFRLFRVAAGSTLTLNDIQVRGGELSGNEENGAAVFVDGGTLTLNNSTLTENVVASGDGGAVFASGNAARVNLNYSLVSYNSASHGGSVALDEGAQLTVYRSALRRNSAAGRGGAVHSERGTIIAVNESQLNSNSAQSGGAVYLGANGGAGATSMTIEGGEVSFNRVNGGLGGAIATKYGDLSIDETQFLYNQSYTGGAIFMGFGDGSLDVDNSSFISNRSVSNSSGGVGTQTDGVGGAISIIADNSHTISNSTISKNLAGTGGAISVKYGSTLLTNVSMIGGEGVPVASGSASLQPAAILYAANEANVTLNNSVAAFGGEGFRYGGEYGQSYAGVSRLPDRVLCATAGSATITSGSGNFFEDDSCGQAADGDPRISRLRSSSASERFDFGAGAKYSNSQQTLRLSSPQYHTPVFNSPLIGAADITICGSSPINGLDQRNLARGVGECDIGATEAVEASVLVDSISDNFNSTAAHCSLRDALLTTGGESDVFGGEFGGGGEYSPRDAATCVEQSDITTIAFDPLVFPSGGNTTISLTANLPRIRSTVSIQGPGRNALQVDGSSEHRVLRASNAHLYLSNFTVANGSAYTGGGISAYGGRFVMRSMAVTGNEGRRAGGVSLSSSHFLISKTTISGNSATNAGTGGLRISGRDVGVVSDSTVSGNRSTDSIAGALSNYQIGRQAGGMSVERGAFTIMKNSTVSGNRSSRTGGGIGIHNASAFLFNSTISNNVADVYGGGINAQQFERGGEGGANSSYEQRSFPVLVNTIVSGNRKGGGTAGVGIPAYGQDLMFVSFEQLGGALNPGDPVDNYIGGSLLGESSVNYAESIYSNVAVSLSLSNSIIATSLDALGNLNPSATALNKIIGPLRFNGGVTRTHNLVDRSPAIDSGSQMFCVGSFITPLVRDQRGRTRNDGSCDIGSVEYQDSACFVVPTANSRVVTFCL